VAAPAGSSGQPALIEQGNQPRGSGAVGIVLAVKLRAQQPLFRTDAREERWYDERREQRKVLEDFEIDHSGFRLEEVPRTNQSLWLDSFSQSRPAKARP
jgi:hypothetical protein